MVRWLSKLHLKWGHKNREKTSKIVFLKCFLWPLPKTWIKIQNHFWKVHSSRFSKLVLKTFLHWQMTEQIASEVRAKNGEKLQKVPFLKSIFWPIAPGQMAEQLAVENGEKLQKVPFLKIFFCNIAPLSDQKNGPTWNLRAK